MSEMSVKDVKYYAGIDLGGTFIKCGIVDSDANILVKGKVPTPSGYENIVEAMANLASALASDCGVRLSGVGIASPGVVDRKAGLVVLSENLGMEYSPLCADIEARVGVKTVIANDANAAALGEYAFGAGKRFESMVMVTLGTGVGGGIIFDGEILEGYKGAGGEIGHIVIHVGGEKCGCGKRGCFEAYCSASALVRSAVKYMKTHPETLLWEVSGGDIDNMNGKLFFEALDRGDKGAKTVYKKYLHNLSCGLASVAAIVRPEAIVLGGGISAEGEKITRPLLKMVNKQLFAGKQVPLKLETAMLKNDAGILGAAKLVME